MRLKSIPYIFVSTWLLSVSISCGNSQAESPYPQFDLYPENFEQLSIEKTELDSLDQSLSSCQLTDELSIDSLRKISNFLTSMILKEMFWNMQQTSKQNIDVEADDLLFMDPMYYKRLYEHNTELFKRFLGDRRIKAIHEILKKGITSDDNSIKNQCFNLALSKFPQQDYMEKALLYLQDKNISGRQFMHLIDLLSKASYEPAIDIIRHLQQSDERAYSFSTKALMRYGISPDREKIRSIIREDMESPSVHAIDILEIAPEEPDIDLLLDTLNRTDAAYAKKKCIDALNKNFSRLNEAQIEKFTEGVYAALQNDSKNLLHPSSKTLFLLLEDEKRIGAKKIMLIVLQSIDTNYCIRYKNNFRRIINKAGEMKLPESLAMLFPLLADTKNDESSQILIDAIDQVTDQEIFTSFPIEKKDTHDPQKTRTAWLSWWEVNRDAIQKKIDIQNSN